MAQHDAIWLDEATSISQEAWDELNLKNMPVTIIPGHSIGTYMPPVQAKKYDQGNEGLVGTLSRYWKDLGPENRSLVIQEAIDHGRPLHHHLAIRSGLLPAEELSRVTAFALQQGLSFDQSLSIFLAARALAETNNMPLAACMNHLVGKNKGKPMPKNQATQKGKFDADEYLVIMQSAYAINVTTKMAESAWQQRLQLCKEVAQRFAMGYTDASYITALLQAISKDTGYYLEMVLDAIAESFVPIKPPQANPVSMYTSSGRKYLLFQAPYPANSFHGFKKFIEYQLQSQGLLPQHAPDSPSSLASVSKQSEAIAQIVKNAQLTATSALANKNPSFDELVIDDIPTISAPDTGNPSESTLLRPTNRMAALQLDTEEEA